MKPKRRAHQNRGKKVAIAVLAVAVVVLAALAAWLVLSPQQGPVDRQKDEPLQAEFDTGGEADREAWIQENAGRPAVHPLIAQCQGLDLRSPIAPADLTGVLFHQASYNYALVMETQLAEADLGVVSVENPVRVNAEQLEGEWLDADALHLWRDTDSTPMDTSIDVGATAGTVVRSPVTGTVVLVRDYMLYDQVPDIEIHIQPDGRPDLDVVLLHTQDPLVSAGDHVEAGVTEISHVRDIASQLTDVQLGYYTRADDPGNHTHVQVNDANFEGYRDTKLEGAITV